MQLRIDAQNNIEVVIPSKRYEHLIDGFIEQRKDWIKKHISNNSKKDKFFDLDEGYVNFLGRKALIIFVKDRPKKYLFKDGKLYLQSLIFPSEKEFESELRKFANTFLASRLTAMAQKHGFEVCEIAIRGQRSRWGSCTRAGNISLNYKLIFYDEAVIDYVIIHELCHLRQMNHSKRFWLEVEAIIPEYKRLRRTLGSLI